MRHESDSKDNTYWLGLLTHLQAPSVKRKVLSIHTLSCQWLCLGYQVSMIAC